MKNIKLFLVSLRERFLRFSCFVNKITNCILLSVVYFFGVGLTSIIAKIFRKDFLKIKKSKNTKTYWISLDLKKKPIEEYYRQF